MPHVGIGRRTADGIDSTKSYKDFFMSLLPFAANTVKSRDNAGALQSWPGKR
jgi:hypothetical protein